MNPFTLSALAALAVLSLAAPSRADDRAPTSEPSRSLHADVEVDPTAYALSGHSLHVGVGWKRFRLDLGAYAMALPRFVHGNDKFDVSFDGYGAKVQYFLFAEQTGAFVGVDGGLTRVLTQLRGTDFAHRDNQLSFGANAGYRLNLPAGFYATAWLGVGYAVNARDVALGGATFKSNPWTIFPAVHLGYRFR